MFSKVLVTNGRLACRSSAIGFQNPSTPKINHQPLRIVPVRTGHLLPPSQYDIPISPKFHFPGVMVKYWELIPIFVTTGISLTILAIAVIWACKNKVDVVFSTHSANNISKTMNLRRPTVHKMLIIYQRYEPWPEMQDVLDKMVVAEHKVMMKATKCTYEQREGHRPPELEGVLD